jgi:endonuclease-3 related protein
VSPAYGEKKKEEEVRQYYRALYRAWGDQHWWPADTRFEVIVGAYLTQNTAWTTVELALADLRKVPTRVTKNAARRIC